MRGNLDALLVLAGGLALGFGGTLLLRAAAESSKSNEYDEVSFDLPERPDAPTRRVSASPDAPLGETPSELRHELDGVLAGSGSARVAEAAKRSENGTPAGRRGWAALLTLYAMGDRSEDFLRTSAEALRAGVDTAEVLDAVRLFPMAKRSDVLSQAIAGSKDAAWNPEHVAGVYFEAGDKDRAAETLVTALHAGARQQLIEQLVAIDPERAAAALKKLSGDSAWNAKRLAQIGDALAKESRPELAAPFFAAALEKDPLNKSLVERLVAVAPAAGLAYARRLTRDQSNNPGAWLSLGAAELSAGSASDAFEAYRQAASRSLTSDALEGMRKADPKRAFDAALPLVNADTDKDTLGAVARLALESERAKDASEMLVRALQRDPSDFEWNAALVSVDPARAADVLKASAQSYRGKKRDEVVGAYGDALLATGNATGAFDQYREAFELDPADGEWQKGLARSDPARAIPMLEGLRRAAGDKGEILGALADAYAARGRADEARSLYAQAFEKGGDASWWGRLALLDPAAGRARLEEATVNNPKSATAWGELGDVLRAQGDAAAAKSAYAKARDLDPKNFTWAARAR